MIQRRTMSLLGMVALAASCSSHGGSTPDAPVDRGAALEQRAERRREACGPDGPNLFGAVEAARYEADLAFIAQPRAPGSAHWQKVQDLCFDRLVASGYATERASFAGGVNVVGKRSGREQPERQILISAHYDHLAGCAGADDNASGVAGALEAARVLATVAHDRTLVVACWDAEEAGMLGSAAYAKAAKQRGDLIEHAFVLDMIGFASHEPDSQTMPDGMSLLWPDQVAAVKANQMRADFIVACHDESEASIAAVDALAASAKAAGLTLYPMLLPAALKDLEPLKPLYNGDHASFWRQGYPSTMLNDTSVYRATHYHCLDGPDTADRLDTPFAVGIVKSVVGAALARLRAAP